MANKLVTCPYDEVHRMKESRLAIHITKCRLNNLGSEKFTCNFNATHILPIQEKDYHMMNCPDRVTVARALAYSALEKNNPFKGNTAVPSYTASLPTPTEEIWDEDLEFKEPAPGYVPNKRSADAIFEPPADSKPAERRKMYQELHKRTAELENDSSKPVQETETKVHVNRQPKAPSQIESRMANEIRHLGVGRGKPVAAPSRIAANIFAPTPASQTTNILPPTPTPQTAFTNNYSAALSGMNNLGFGRGYAASTVNDNVLEEDFPALGCGRGVYRTAKNGVRYPGSRN